MLAIKQLFMSDAFVYNGEKINSIRKIILKSKHFGNHLSKCTDKDIDSTYHIDFFLSDFRICRFFMLLMGDEPIFQNYFENLSDNDKKSYTFHYCLVLIYIKCVFEKCLIFVPAICDIYDVDRDSMQLSYLKFIQLIDGRLYCHLHDYFTMDENFEFLLKSIYEDIYWRVSAKNPYNRMHIYKNILGSLTRLSGHHKFDNIIAEICNIANERWEKDISEFQKYKKFHQGDMLNSFKRDDGYKKYFDEHGFETQLKRELKKIAMKYGRFWGDNKGKSKSGK
jgi:hypothetical protein